MTGLKNIIRSMKGNRSLYSSLLLQTVIIMIYISTISADIFQPHRNSDIDDGRLPPNNNIVTTYNECKDHLMRKKRQFLPDSMRPTEEDTDFTSTTTSNQADETEVITLIPKKAVCNEQDFSNGLKTFQKNYRLDITGVCDERTTNQMSQRRCGQPDTVIDSLEDEVTTKSSRQARSLSDIISENVEREQSIERRKAQLQQFMKDIENEKATPKHPNLKAREKRSQIYMASSDYGGLLSKRRISWRLMSDHLSHIIRPNKQRSILRQAFHYWSAVAPFCFYEDTDSWDRVDIEIGFLEGVHLSCYRQFDGYGGELAHKFYRDVHFDNSEPYTEDLTSSTSISLLLVAVHELGHVIGLNHSTVENSVMNAIYHQRIHGSFELSPHDRNEVKRSYGGCDGEFNTVFDFVKTKRSTRNTRVYSTYFFRGDHCWMYENSRQKARTGDPLLIEQDWPKALKNVDGFLHYSKYSGGNSGTFYDEYLFFKGDRYYKYDPNLDSVVENNLIRSKFVAHNSTGPKIPINIDAVFFDGRSNVSQVFFFKDDTVYAYNYDPSHTHSCCVSVRRIVDVFPPASSSDLRTADGNSYASDIDAVYYSNYHRNMYFIKGHDVWVNELYMVHANSNRMRYLGKWYDLWQFICDGECS